MLTAVLATLLITRNVAIDTFSLTPPQFWYIAFATDGWMPVVGDADGDGHADLIALWPNGDGVIDLARTSPLGKMHPIVQARQKFGQNGIAVVAGPFTRKGADLLAIDADGSVHLASGMAPGTETYLNDDLIAKLPPDLIPTAPVMATSADFLAHGKTDALFIDSKGKALLLENRTGADGKPAFLVHSFKTPIPDVRQLASGRFAGSTTAQTVWLDSSGNLSRSHIAIEAGGQARLTDATVIAKVSPDEHMVAGRFRGNPDSDILVGQTLYTGGDPARPATMPDIPALEVAKSDGPWLVGDFDGNGKDDLVRLRRSNERFNGNDTYVHFSYDASDADKGYTCSSNDGLLDIWKEGKVKPGGLDLKAIGCKVGRRDIIIELERFVDVPEGYVTSNMDRVIKFFADLPCKNPDGSTGIAMHVIYSKPWAKSEHDRLMGNFDGIFPPVDHRGMVHTMFAENSGPLVSMVNGINGHYNGGWHEFVHELGHQLDLSHEGWWGPSNCALYPSLMSYTYSYSLFNNGERVCYSDGSFDSFVINELHLSKHLPFPIGKVEFLANGPYNFKIKPTADGKGTLVDWNWDGLFDETDVVADVNYDHGMDAGPVWGVGTAQTAPVLINAAGKLQLFYGQKSGNGMKLVMRQLAHPPSLALRQDDAPPPGTLSPGKGQGVADPEPKAYERSEVGKGESRVHPTTLDLETDPTKTNQPDDPQWTDETVVEENGLLGDPTGVYLNRASTWIAYATHEGVVLRSIQEDGKIGTPQLIPFSDGAQPTLCTFDGRLVLLLWRGPTEKIGMRLLRAGSSQITIGPESPLDIYSGSPVGASEGPTTAGGPSFWVVREDTGNSGDRGRSEMVQFELGRDRVISPAYRSWIDGRYKSHRKTLIWQPEKGLEPLGRTYMFTGGVANPAEPWSEQYITMNIPYKDVGGGWLYRRFYQPDFTSVSAPGACFFEGNIAYAIRRRDDTLQILFSGNGATNRPMGDFNDVAHICNYGLSRSLRNFFD